MPACSSMTVQQHSLKGLGVWPNLPYLGEGYTKLGFRCGGSCLGARATSVLQQDLLSSIKEALSLQGCRPTDCHVRSQLHDILQFIRSFQSGAAMNRQRHPCTAAGSPGQRKGSPGASRSMRQLLPCALAAPSHPVFSFALSAAAHELCSLHSRRSHSALHVTSGGNLGTWLQVQRACSCSGHTLC